MTTIILTRPGHVDWLAPERFRGRANLVLTGTGQRQAAATAAFIRSAWPQAAAVYTSSMGRCLDPELPLPGRSPPRRRRSPASTTSTTAPGRA